MQNDYEDESAYMAWDTRSVTRYLLWRDAHLARSKFTAENFSGDVGRSESGELSKDGHRSQFIKVSNFPANEVLHYLARS